MGDGTTGIACAAGMAVTWYILSQKGLTCTVGNIQVNYFDKNN